MPTGPHRDRSSHITHKITACSVVCGVRNPLTPNRAEKGIKMGRDVGLEMSLQSASLLVLWIV